MVSRPMVLSRVCRSLISVVMMRAPVMPKGWPRAMAPPLGLSWSSMLIPSSSQTGRTWAANASLSSTMSMSVIFMPDWASTLRTASIGPTPMISGARPVTALAMMRTLGFRPSAWARSSDMTSVAAAAGTAHALEPAGDVGVTLAHLDGVKGHADGLQGGGAEAVDACARHAVGQSGQRRAVAGVVHALLAGMVGGAHHDVDHRCR